MTAVSVLGRRVNTVVMPLVRRFSRWPDEPGKSAIAVLSYRGRKSGKGFSLVMVMRRTEDGAVVTVELPDQKRWWRNFIGTPAPATITAGGTERTGQARAEHCDDGRVRVHITFD